MKGLVSPMNILVSPRQLIFSPVYTIWKEEVLLPMVRINALNTKQIILKKMIISFLVNFCLGKYSFSLNTFQT